ncbi:MAG: UDP-3-O-(3-hydroxymyristoyl)glucosamine N-acyltransferase, partial [Phycisphaerae bacterium]
VRAASRIGSRVRIGPNSVIGYDGFGYRTIDGVHHRIPHIGNVVIEDDVEIGACTCVDRAKFGSTRIGAGAKIDNLVMVAHNCQIGPGSILVGQAGIAGSVRLGRYVVLGGHSGLRDNITVGDGAQVAAYSGVSGDVPAGGKVAGTPARPAKEALRIFQCWPRLPELLKRVKKLESRIEALGCSEDH